MNRTSWKPISLFLLTCVLVSLTACVSIGGSKVILVPDEEPLQVAEDVEFKAHIFVNGVRSKNAVKIKVRAGQWVRVADPGK